MFMTTKCSIDDKCVYAQPCPTLCDPMDCNPPGSSVHGVFQARILERVAVSSLPDSGIKPDFSHFWYVVGILVVSSWISFKYCSYKYFLVKYS